MGERPFPIAEIHSPGTQARFLVKDVPPPSPLYVDEKDILVIESNCFAAGVQLGIRTRLLRVADGRIVEHQENLNPSGLYVASQLTIPLTEGYLLSLTVNLFSGSALPGENYVKVMLSRGGSARLNWTQVLTEGHISTHGALTWPNGPMQAPGDGRGFIRTIIGTNPAAGAEISEAVPTGALWRLIAIRATLVCDATVITRQPFLIIDDGATNIFQRYAETWATAGATGTFYGADIGFAPISNISSSSWALPGNFLLPQDHRIRTSTVGLQAGDNWGAPQMLVEQWFYQ
jgi:hypothetical protein